MARVPYLLIRLSAFALCIDGLEVTVSLLVRSEDTAHDRARVSSLQQAAKAEAAKATFKNAGVRVLVEGLAKTQPLGLWNTLSWIVLHDKKVRSRKNKAGKKLPWGCRWVVVIEPTTVVDLPRLVTRLAGYDFNKPLFLGHLLEDTGRAHDHRYQLGQPYPLPQAGFALSAGLIRRLLEDVQQNRWADQVLDPTWELAARIRGVGVELEDDAVFCTELTKPSCVTSVQQPLPPSTDQVLGSGDVVIAVKTVSHNHANRLPILHELWANSTLVDVVYMSNAGFDGIAGAQVVDLSPEFGAAVDPAVEAVADDGSGHCSKMLSILQYLQRHRSGKRWYVVTDDDTLLSVEALLEVLQSHDDSVAVALGEFVGIGFRPDPDQFVGRTYVNTGAGFALSGPALQALKQCQTKAKCQCRTANFPDDESLGSWLPAAGVKMMREEGFHQHPPQNYHPELLRWGKPAVSFHRFALHQSEIPVKNDLLLDGEESCQGLGLDSRRCWAVGCCQWDQHLRTCMSNVGRQPCRQITGSAACSGRADQEACESVGCCQWAGRCTSAVGNAACQSDPRLQASLLDARIATWRRYALHLGTGRIGTPKVQDLKGQEL